MRNPSSPDGTPTGFGGRWCRVRLSASLFVSSVTSGQVTSLHGIQETLSSTGESEEGLLRGLFAWGLGKAAGGGTAPWG